MHFNLETNRLILRPLTISDADDFFLMNANPNVSRYLRFPLQTKAEAADYIMKILNEYQKNGIGRFAVMLKETHKLIGFSGLKYRDKPENNHVDFYDIGYRFSEDYWGNGYATEAALAWLKHGFSDMNLETIYACAVTDNVASNHLLKKIGFVFINQYFANGAMHNWYQLEKKQYKWI